MGDDRELNAETIKDEKYRKEMLDYAISLDNVQKKVLYETEVGQPLRNPLNIIDANRRALLPDAPSRQHEYIKKMNY